MKRVKIKSVMKVHNTSDRYDLQVRNTSNFFADNVLVHNSNFQASYYPAEDLFVVASKGIAARGLAFKLDDEANANNLYVREFEDLKSHMKNSGLVNYLQSIGEYFYSSTPFAVFGEIAGPGVQKGFTYGNKEPQLYIFDIYVGKPGQGRFLNRATELRPAIHALSEWGGPSLHLIPHPEYIYEGPWDSSRLKEWTDGKNPAGHVEEGVVICAERPHSKLGSRVLLKSISDAYLLRGGDTTEYN